MSWWSVSRLAPPGQASAPGILSCWVGGGGRGEGHMVKTWPSRGIVWGEFKERSVGWIGLPITPSSTTGGQWEPSHF